MADQTPEEKAAAEKAAAEAAEKAAADKATADKAAQDAALKAKLDAADAKTADLEKRIKEMKESIAAGQKKGESVNALETRLAEAERRLVDAEKTMLQMHEREKAAIEQSNAKTIETDVRATLDGALVDGVMGMVIKTLRADGLIRVDSDGKVAVNDGKGNWGSLSRESLLAHIPDALKASSGVPGGGGTRPAEGGRTIRTDAMAEGEASQAGYKKRRAEILANMRR